MIDTGNNKAIFRIKKINLQRQLRAALAHNLRLVNPPNVNTELSHYNIQAKGLNTIEVCMSRFESALEGIKVRKNAVLAHEAIITGSPDHMNKLTKKQQIAYFTDAAHWLVKLHGGDYKNILCLSIHYDESGTHAHYIIMPKIDSKLNSRAIIGGARGRLSELQTEFYEKVAKKYGFTRGIKNSKATHQHYSEFKNLKNDLSEVKNKLEQTQIEYKTALNRLSSAQQSLLFIKKELKLAKTLGVSDLRRKIALLEKNTIFKMSSRI
ncbi:MobV family relaxase [Pseudoalteromonas sp. MMG007]|uniref:MobV family relaxase n=1 Tax=Pseudoalteromonas sp. MMG007 TaxID=2822684 RepID=UPI001B372564|nr:MobV family relaxase [Pseudoalteromonas sp. MMG007]MBQ4857239.1 plasmid recombination protein [Pseudoalteromonas sp. MMG007]